MVSKLKSLEKADDNALVEAVCSSAHEIWQAGLGAFARAQEEGNELFTKLVQQGEELQKRTQHLAEGKGLGIADTVTKLAENVGKQATGSIEKLEKVFEERVARSLRSIGVPTHDDIKGLSKQIDELSQLVMTLAQKQSAAVKAAAKTAPARTASKAAPRAIPKTASKSTVKSAAAKGAARTAAKKQSRQVAGHA